LVTTLENDRRHTAKLHLRSNAVIINRQRSSPPFQNNSKMLKQQLPLHDKNINNNKED